MTSAEPSLLLAAGSLILGLAASVLWTVTRHLITMVHEGSHAFFGSATGGRIAGIVLNPDGTGATSTSDAGPFITGLAGYLGAPLFGIAGATLLAHGVRPGALLWISFVLMVVVFVQIRNVFGWFIVGSYGAIFFVLARNGSDNVHALAAYSWIWFLLLGGVIQTFESNVKRVGWSGDADALRTLTRLPRGLWGGFWWLTTLSALVYGGGILLGLIDPPLA